MKIFKSALSYRGQRCDVTYFPTKTFDDIPDNLIIKIHAVCFWNKKLLLVKHSEWNIFGIPGGTREKEEKIIETLQREVQEETNCSVLDYRPLSYQKIVTANQDIHYRAQYICNVMPLGEFESDPAGSVNKIIWVNPNDFEKYVEKNEMRQAIFRRALSVYKDFHENT